MTHYQIITQTSIEVSSRNSMLEQRAGLERPRTFGSVPRLGRWARVSYSKTMEWIETLRGERLIKVVAKVDWPSLWTIPLILIKALDRASNNKFKVVEDSEIINQLGVWVHKIDLINFKARVVRVCKIDLQDWLSTRQRDWGIWSTTLRQITSVGIMSLKTSEEESSIDLKTLELRTCTYRSRPTYLMKCKSQNDSPKPQ